MAGINHFTVQKYYEQKNPSQEEKIFLSFIYL